jgi:hypothetical protein
MSMCDARCHCEYVVDGLRAVIHFLCTLELTARRHFCSILKHEYSANASTSDGC